MPSFTYRNVPPQLLQTGLVAEWDFTEGWNTQVFNRINTPVYQNPPNLLGVLSEQYAQKTDANFVPWVLTGATITDFFATDPNGVANNASRLVTSSGSNLMFYTITLAAVPYTLSIWAKSNTGSSQTFRLGNANAPGGDQTVTTTWTRFTQTFTPSAGAVLVGFLNDVAHDALDILIYGAELVLGSSASTTYTPQALNFQLGINASTPTLAPTFVADGLQFGASKLCKADNKGLTTFTNITMYGVFKKPPASDAPGFFEPIITSDDTGNYSIIMESRDILNSGTAHDSTGPCFGFGFTGHIVNAANAKIDDGNYHVFVGTYDGTNVKLYIDGTQCEQKLHTISSQTLHRFMLGAYEGNNSAATSYFPGTLGILALYNVAHTAAQVRAQTATLQADMAARGVSMPVQKTFIGIEGDSIPAGLGIKQGERWSNIILNTITPTVQQWDGAVGGSTTANVTSRMPIFNQILDNPALTKKILILELGANDLVGVTAATFVANYKALCIAEKAAGWTLVFITLVLPRGDVVGFNAKKDAANAALLADPDFSNGNAADGIAQFDATILANTAPADPTLFQADQVHPTALANSAHMEPSIQTLVAAHLP